MTMSGSSTAKKTEITTINIRVVLFASRCLLFSLRAMIFMTIMLMVIVIVCKYSHNHDNEVFKVMIEKGDYKYIYKYIIL